MSGHPPSGPLVPSGPAALPDLRDFMAFMVSCFVGGLVLTFNSCLAGGMSGGADCGSVFRIALKCSTNLTLCSIFPSDGLSALVSDRASGVACFSRQHSCDLIESGLGGLSGLINGLIAAAIGAFSMLMSEPTAKSNVKRTRMFVLSIATLHYITLHISLPRYSLCFLREEYWI